MLKLHKNGYSNCKFKHSLRTLPKGLRARRTRLTKRPAGTAYASYHKGLRATHGSYETPQPARTILELKLRLLPHLNRAARVLACLNCCTCGKRRYESGHFRVADTGDRRRVPSGTYGSPIRSDPIMVTIIISIAIIIAIMVNYDLLVSLLLLLLLCRASFASAADALASSIRCDEHSERDPDSETVSFII